MMLMWNLSIIHVIFFKDDKLIRNLDCSMNPFDVVGKILSSSTIYGLAKTILKKI